MFYFYEGLFSQALTKLLGSFPQFQQNEAQNQAHNSEEEDANYLWFSFKIEMRSYLQVDIEHCEHCEGACSLFVKADQRQYYHLECVTQKEKRHLLVAKHWKNWNLHQTCKGNQCARLPIHFHKERSYEEEIHSGKLYEDNQACCFFTDFVFLRH